MSEPVSYRDLLLSIEPRPVESEEQADAYRQIVQRLLVPGMSEGQKDMIALLGQLIYNWEEQHEEPVAGTPQGVVHLLLEDRELRQRDLVPAVFLTESAVSDFLSGRRPLSYARVTKLADFFSISPALFYPGATD